MALFYLKGVTILYIKKRYICGNYIEEERYSLPNNLVASKNRPRTPRDKTKLSTSEREEQNYKKSEKKARRLANTNFINGKDLFVTVTGKTFKTLEEFNKMMKNFVERLRYYFKINNIGELKYLYSFGEHKELSKENKVGVHSHLVVSGLPIDKLIEIWEVDKDAGQIHISKLRFDNKGGLAGLMRYFIKNAKELKQRYRERGEYNKVKNMRAYSPSLNLKKPKGGKTEYITRKQMQEQPTARKGFLITDVENTHTSYGVYQVIHILKIENMRL